MKTIIALILCVGAMAAETNVPPPASTNLIILNQHQKFYRAVEIRRSQIHAQQAQISDVINRLTRVMNVKSGATGEAAERKKYEAAQTQLSKAEQALQVQVAEYELHNANARQWDNWWVRTNAAARRPSATRR